MTYINIKDFIKNIEFLKEGAKISPSNNFVKAFDSNNDNIFQLAELEALKHELETASGTDKNLNNDEAINLLKTKFKNAQNISSEKLENAKNYVLKSINTLIANNIAEKMHTSIENNFQWASLSSKDFKNALDKINSSNVLLVLNSYRQISSAKESLPVAIIKERTNSNEKITETLDKLFESILENIDPNLYDLDAIKTEWNDIKKTPGTLDTEIVDKFFNKITEQAGTDKNLTTTEDSTYEAVNTRTQTAEETKNKQLNNQGAVSRFLDDISGNFGGITEENVEAALTKQKSINAQLEAAKKNPAEFARVFKEIYGIEYSKTAVANFEKKQETYNEAMGKYGFYKFLSENLADVKEKTNLHWTPGTSATELKKTYDKLYNTLCQTLKKETVDYILNSADLGNPPQLWKKYEVLRPLALSFLDAAETEWKNFSQGKPIESYEAEKTGAYHAAFGKDNDALMHAEDWVSAQQNRYAVAQVGSQILAGAVSFAGGPLAILGAATIMADPVQLTEKMTDTNGMSKEDWNTYWDSRVETIGWMAVGGSVGGVAKLAKTAAATKMLKLKGLSQIANAGGKSLDDIINTGNLSDEALASIKSVQRLSNLTGFTTEASLDILTTAMLQEGNVTKGDWIMSLAGALAGSGFVNNLKLCKDFDSAHAKLKEMLSDFNWSEENARNFFGKLEIWANQKTPSTAMYSSVLPISPAMIEKFTKGLVRGAFKLENLLSSYITSLNKDLTSKPQMKDAVEESLLKVTKDIVEKGYACKEMIDENALKDIAEKHGVKTSDLCNKVKQCINKDKNWVTTVGPNLLNMSERSAKLPSKLKEIGPRIESFMKKIDPETTEATPIQPANPKIVESPKVENSTPVVEKNSTANVANNPEETFKVTEELWNKYPDVTESKHWDDEFINKAIKLMEDYEQKIENGTIKPEEFEKTDIYMLMNEYHIHDYDKDRLLPLIKNRFHSELIANDAKIKERMTTIRENLKITNLSDDTMKATFSLIDDLKALMNSNKKISETELETLLCEIDARKSIVENMKKILYNDPRISNWLNDCTHKDVLTNPKYRGEEFYYEDVNFDEALKWFDEILDKVNNGEKLSLKMIEDTYKGLDTNGNSKMQYSCSDELLIDIIQNHWLLGPMYKEFA